MPSPAPPSPARLLDLIDAFQARPILMAADLVADRFITGRPKRISREAPVLILRQESDELVPGGGANAAFNIHSLGGRPLVAGIVGRDPNGDELLEIFRRSGISTDGILQREGYRTPTKTRVLGGARHAIKQQIVRFDVEDIQELAEVEREALQSFLEQHASQCEVAILSDYGLGAVEPAFVQILGAAKKQLLCIGDSRYRLEKFVGLEGATPNQEELENIEGGLAESEVTAAARRLQQHLGARFLLLTRGSEGMQLIDDDGALRVPCHGTNQVADVTGAGDTVIATFALASAAGASPYEATILANYAAGTVVMKMGTATVSPDELREAVRNNPALLEDLSWESW